PGPLRMNGTYSPRRSGKATTTASAAIATSTNRPRTTFNACMPLSPTAPARQRPLKAGATESSSPPWIEPEQAGGVAAEDVALGLLLEERQVVDDRGQVEVPVRIVGRPDQLGLGVDHLEGGFEDREVVRDLHRLRGVEHLAHVFARLALAGRA